MANQLQTFPIEFRGGLVSNLSPLQQGLNAVGSATTLQNFEPSKDGGYKKVLGYTKFSDTVIPGSEKVLGVKVVNAEKIVVARKNGGGLTQYYLNNGVNWDSLGTAASLGGRVRGVGFNFDGDNKILFVDGVNKPCIFNETSDTLSFPTISAAFPVDLVGASHAAVLNGTIFVANGSNLIFSSLFNELDWSAASGGGIINIGQIITGLAVFRDQLIIFATDSIKSISGNTSSDFVLSNITDKLGCPYVDTIQEVGGDIMFMGPDGIRFLSATQRNEDFGLSLASSPIPREVKAFMDAHSSFTSLVIRGKNQYRIFGYSQPTSVNVSKGLLATQFVDQEAVGMQWSTLLGFKAYCADSRYTDTGEIIVFANEDGYVYKLEDGFSRDGEAIKAIYQSPFMPISDPMKRKTLYKMILYTKTSGQFSVNLNIYYDMYKINNYNTINPSTIEISTPSEDLGGVWGSGVYGTMVYGGKLDDVHEKLLVGAGKTFSFKLTDSTLNPSFNLDMALIEYREHDRL